MVLPIHTIWMEYYHILIKNFRLDNESVETINSNLIETKLCILQFSNNDKNSEMLTIIFKITSKMEIQA